jgi:hypothetical protein
VSDAWEMLVRTALLGTDRQPVDLTGLPAAVRDRLPEDAEPGRLLLDAAALSAGYRRAGFRPLTGIRLDEPAPADDRPLVPAAAASRLGRLLGGEHAGLLPEWLALVAALGLRVPPERLPALAEAAWARTVLRPPVAAAAGPRGPWLAARAPQWGFLADARTATDGAEDVWRHDVWQHGGTVARWAWLERARRTDPDRARAALAEVWPTEPATVRATFLETLRIGLGAADEDFLESALDDRAQEVRRLAAGLLVRLPGSRLGLRMADRLAALVTVRRRGPGWELAVELPAECDAAMRRDGVQPVPPARTGERTWWLRQVVASAPLSWWSRVEADPQRLLRLPVAGRDGESALHTALASAAVDQQDPTWAAALLTDRTAALSSEDVADLIAVLPKDRWADAVAVQVAGNRLAPLGAVFLALPGPWPADLGDLVLDQLDAQAAQRTLAPIADAAARCVPPECCHHRITERVGAQDACPWHHRLVETLLFRRAMYEELS